MDKRTEKEMKTITILKAQATGHYELYSSTNKERRK